MPNKFYIQDNIHVLRGIDSDSIDLIATDPPFNSNRIFNSIETNKKNDKTFDDRWKWDEVKEEWTDLIGASYTNIVELIEAAAAIEGGTVNKVTGKINTGNVPTSIAAFLCYMAPRIIEMYRVLKPTGSLFLHCDDSANSYLRLLLDAVFGRENYRNTITWLRAKSGKSNKTNFGRNSDTIFYYVKSNKAVHNQQFGPLLPATLKSFRYDDNDGKGKYALRDISFPGGNGYRFDLGLGEKPPKGGYSMPYKTAIEWIKSGRMVVRKGLVPTQKRYLKDCKGFSSWKCLV